MGRRRRERAYHAALFAASGALLALTLAQALPAWLGNAAAAALVVATAWGVRVPRRVFRTRGELPDALFAVSMGACYLGALPSPPRYGFLLPVILLFLWCCHAAARELETVPGSLDGSSWARRVKRGIERSPELSDSEVTLLWGAYRVPGRRMVAWMVATYMLGPPFVGGVVLAVEGALLADLPLVEAALFALALYLVLWDSARARDYLGRLRREPERRTRQEWTARLDGLWQPRILVLTLMMGLFGLLGFGIAVMGGARVWREAADPGASSSLLLAAAFYVGALALGMTHSLVACQRLLSSAWSRAPLRGWGVPTYVGFVLATLLMARFASASSLASAVTAGGAWALVDPLACGAFVAILAWSALSRAERSAREARAAFWALLAHFAALLVTLGGWAGASIVAGLLLVGGLWRTALPLARRGEKPGKLPTSQLAAFIAIFVLGAAYAALDRLWWLAALCLLGVAVALSARAPDKVQERFFRHVLGITIRRGAGSSGGAATADAVAAPVPESP